MQGYLDPEKKFGQLCDKDWVAALGSSARISLPTEFRGRRPVKVTWAGT